jgi:outer membrane protein
MNTKSVFTVILICLAFSASPVFSEEITTVGVVDVNKIYNDFYFESEEVRELQDMKEEFEDELLDIKQQIEQLRERRKNAADRGNNDLVLQLDEEIVTKENYFNDVKRIRQKQLEQKQSSFLNSEFYIQLNEALTIVGERKGFTAVFRKRAEGLMWYHPSIDITELVLEELRRISSR